MARLRRIGSLVVLLLATWSTGCQAPGTIPWRAEDAAAPREDALVWVSYQIRIDTVDGREASIQASEPCVYYPVTLRAGEHKLGLRLDYQSAIHQVRSAESVGMTVRLDAGKEYRLIDLSADQQRERVFTPWLQAGAPPAGTVARPAKRTGVPPAPGVSR